MPPRRPTTLRLMIVVAIPALLMAWFDAALLRPVREHTRWFYAVRDRIESLKDRRPPEVGRAEWGYVVGWTLNAHGNCCSFRGSVKPADMWPFAEALDRRLRGRVGMDTIDWIWDEYVRISTVGPSYSRSYRPTAPERLKDASTMTWAGLEVK